MNEPWRWATPGKAEWMEVIGFKGCVIIWRIQRMCLCLLPTHSVPVWRQRAEGGWRRGWICSHHSVLVSPIGLYVLPEAAGLRIYLIYIYIYSIWRRCLWTRLQTAPFTRRCSLIKNYSFADLTVTIGLRGNKLKSTSDMSWQERKLVDILILCGFL